MQKAKCCGSILLRFAGGVEASCAQSMPCLQAMKQQSTVEALLQLLVGLLGRAAAALHCAQRCNVSIQHCRAFIPGQLYPTPSHCSILLNTFCLVGAVY